MKVLIITYYFFQNEAIGSFRLRGLNKYLKDYGWEPTILTIKTNESEEVDCNVIKTEFADPIKTVKKKYKLNDNILSKLFLRVWLEINAYPDVQKKWIKTAVESGRKLLREEQFDAIISSSSPISCHLIAHDLKKEFDIPWIADFRDLWTQNHYYNYTPIRKFFERRLELGTLKNVDAITTVSKELSKDLERLHKSKNIYTIHNGFDPEDVNLGMPLTSKFSITYTGQLYNKKRDPEDFFKVINELLEEEFLNSDDISVELFCQEESWLFEEIKNLNLGNIVNINGTISHQNSILQQRMSQILLLLMWNNPKEKGVCTGKIFEYLAAKRPIVSYGVVEGCVPTILSETNSGIAVNNKNDLKNLIKMHYNSYKNNGYVEFNSSNKILKFSQKTMAKKFNELLNKVSL